MNFPLNLSKYPFLYEKYPPAIRTKIMAIMIIQVVTGVEVSHAWEQHIWVEDESLDVITLPEHLSGEHRLPACSEQVEVAFAHDPRQHLWVSIVVLISPEQVSSAEHSTPARSEQNFWQLGSFMSIKPFPSLSKLSSQVVSGISHTPFLPVESVTVSPRHPPFTQSEIVVHAEVSGLQQVSPERQESVVAVSPERQESLQDPPLLMQSPIGGETVFGHSEKRMNDVSLTL